MVKTRRQRPYAWLPFLILVMTLVALVIVGVGLYYIEDRLIATHGESLSLSAADIAEKLDRLLFERYSDVRMMANAFGMVPRDPAYLSAYLAWMKQWYAVYLWLGVTDKDGRIVAATDGVSIGQDVGQEPWFRAVREDKTTHIGDVAPYETVGGMDAVAFTSPIMGPKGEFFGTVSTRVGLTSLEDLAVQTLRTLHERMRLAKIEYQFLTRSGLAFIDSDLQHKGNVNLKTLKLPSALMSASGEPDYIEEQHLRRHVAVVTGYAKTRGFREFPGLEWAVLVRIDREEILSPILDILLKLTMAGAAVWTPMFLLLFWSTVRLRREYSQAQQESARASEAEATLRDTVERQRQIVEMALDAVIVMNEDGRIAEWNPQAEKVFGWSRQEAIGRLLYTMIIPPRYREAHRRGIERFVATGEGPMLKKRVELAARHRDGHEFPVELAISPSRRGDAWSFSAFVRDISELKMSERRRSAQYAVTLVLAEASTLGDAAPKILKAICESLDWQVGAVWSVDLTVKRLRCVELWHDPATQISAFETVSRDMTFAAGVGLPGRVWATRQPAWIPDVVRDANFPRAPAAAREGLHGAFGFPILSGEKVVGVLEFYSHEIRQPDPDLLQMFTAIGAQIGQFTERKQLEQQFLQAQKMEAVGLLAGGVAHDFNNMLTVINGYSQLMLGDLPPDNPLAKQLTEIKKAGDSAAALTRQLLAFSRKQVLSLSVLDVNTLMADLKEMLRRLLREDIELITVLDPQLGPVRADASQIEQVIVNLVINARDAMPQGGYLTIETTNVELDEVYARQHPGVQPGSYAMLAVSDTGSGMDEETLVHIFEPFFTTKAKGQGTGLGLSTAYGIVKQSGGTVSVYSVPGLGTTFKVYLPRILEASKPVAAAVEEPAAVNGEPGTILLVEDEPALRAFVREVLQRNRYTVIEAPDGAEALMLGTQHAEPIHMLISDVVMPRMSGRELADRLTAIYPGLKVVYMSGFTDDAIVRHGVLEKGIQFLQKPFTPEALLRKVREVLSG